jgi:molybdopterin-guanine dinucleotide biosynthesis protein A
MSEKRRLSVSRRAIALTGILLAGGKSQRMGRDKRFLDLGGMTLFRRALSVFELLFREIVIVVAEPAPQLSGLPHRVVTDLIANCGSLGGLYTGLSHASRPRIFAAACDMPFLDARTIQHMAELDEHADVVMARLVQGLQPMHAIYSKACLPHLERMIEGKDLKIQNLIHAKDLSVRLIQEEEIRSLDPQFLSFLNINSPADLEFAQKLLAARRADSAGHT